jgi:hypothetical protein
MEGRQRWRTSLQELSWRSPPGRSAAAARFMSRETPASASRCARSTSNRARRTAASRLRHVGPLYRPSRPHRHHDRSHRAAPRLDPWPRRRREVSSAR